MRHFFLQFHHISLITHIRERVKKTHKRKMIPCPTININYGLIFMDKKVIPFFLVFFLRPSESNFILLITIIEPNHTILFIFCQFNVSVENWIEISELQQFFLPAKWDRWKCDLYSDSQKSFALTHKSSNRANAPESRRMRCHIIYGWCVCIESEMNVLDALFIFKFWFRSICCCCPDNMVRCSSFPFLLLLIFCHLDAVYLIRWCALLKAFRFLYHRIFFNCRCLCKLWVVDKICKTMS